MRSNLRLSIHSYLVPILGVALGLLILGVTAAISPAIQFEAETGTLSSGAGVVMDATASDGKMLRFSSTQPLPVNDWVKIEPPGVAEAIGVGLSPANPKVIYLDAYNEFPPDNPNQASSGIYKSTDSGNTWVGPIGTSFKNYDGTTYTGGNPWKRGVSWTITVDPTDADVVYAISGFAGPQGPWKSVDGGNTWRYILSNADAQAMTADVYAIAINPRDHNHLLMTFHSPWNFGASGGVAESRDGGNTWIKHPVTAVTSSGHYAFFLGQDDAGNPSSDTWILATQGHGFWRTMNAGQTWTQVSSQYNMQHGAGGMYRASTGVLYMGALSHVIRSTDNGKTWADAGAPSNQDGYNTVIGDGTRMFVQSANTGTNTTGPQSFYTSLETDGTHWTAYNSQKFNNGPGWMAVDRTNNYVYAALWSHGLWRLKTSN